MDYCQGWFGRVPVVLCTERIQYLCLLQQQDKSSLKDTKCEEPVNCLSGTEAIVVPPRPNDTAQWNETPRAASTQPNVTYPRVTFLERVTCNLV